MYGFHKRHQNTGSKTGEALKGKRNKSSRIVADISPSLQSMNRQKTSDAVNHMTSITDRPSGVCQSLCWARAEYPLSQGHVDHVSRQTMCRFRMTDMIQSIFSG